jgi:hypothetical protein
VNQRFPEWADDFPLLYNIQTDPTVSPASYPVGKKYKKGKVVPVLN